MGWPGSSTTFCMQLGRPGQVVKGTPSPTIEALAIACRASVHLSPSRLRPAGLQSCARSGRALEPPVGNWD